MMLLVVFLVARVGVVVCGAAFVGVVVGGGGGGDGPCLSRRRCCWCQLFGYPLVLLLVLSLLLFLCM